MTAGEQGPGEVLGQLEAGAPLPRVLSDLMGRAEARDTDMLCAVLLLVGEHLRLAAAPTLPQTFRQGIDGLAAAAEAGCCGAAVTSGQRSLVNDLADLTDLAGAGGPPAADRHAHLMAEAGLAACWAQPILTAGGQALGVFATYFSAPRAPNVEDLHFLSAVAHLAAVAVEHDRSKEALLSAGALGELLAAHAPHPLLLIDLEGLVRHAGRGLPGRSAAELVGRRLFDLLPDGHGDGLRRCVEKLAADGEAALFEPASGQAACLSYSLSPVHHDGRVAACALAVLDLGERRRREQALEAELERIRAALLAIGDGVIITDPDGRVTFMNPTAEVLTGWLVQDGEGRPLSEVFRLIHEPGEEPVADPLERCRNLGRISETAGRGILLARSGREYAVDDSASRIRGAHGEDLGIVLVFSDVTETRRLAQQMAHQTTHDALTGLVNRREFVQRLERAQTNVRSRGSEHVLCYLNLDQFKMVNDAAGHLAGDELLRQIARLLLTRVRSRDTLARLGGDEFCLLLEHCPLDKAPEVAEALLAVLRGFRFTWEERSFEVSMSIGLVPVTPEGGNTAHLLQRARQACYAAKGQGRGRVHLYRSEDQELARRHLEVLRASELSEALEENRFRLFCQPIFSLTAGLPQVGERAPAYEILLRLRDSSGGLLLPGAFLSAAERYGMMPEIDRWVIRAVLERFGARLTPLSGQSLSINLSWASIADETLPHFIDQALREFGVEAQRICFEINERAAIHHLERTATFAEEMRGRGFLIALDDFGRGMSSFSYLKRLPVDYLKIHGSFVREMLHEPVDNAMVVAINQVGHSLGIRTIGESAESEAAVERLRQLGVDFAQGFALGSPRPVEDIFASLNTPA